VTANPSSPASRARDSPSSTPEPTAVNNQRLFVHAAVSCSILALTAGSASAQSLFRKPTTVTEDRLPLASAPAPIVAGQPLPPNPVADLDGVSLYAIQPLPPRQIQINDLVTIIVNQSSKIERDQTLETDKETSTQVDVNQFIDLGKLFTEGQFVASNSSRLPSIDVNSGRTFDGQGDMGREDRITARITAKVIDVKPNGLVVLEARASLFTDDEEQLMLISGICRVEDVTQSNTIQSTQLADLRLEVINGGEVRDAAKKGFITKALDAIFAF
jgi:flagellar L-ring protein precursor FlgH